MDPRHQRCFALQQGRPPAPLTYVLIDYWNPMETVDTALLEAMEDDVEESDPVAIV